MRFRWTLALWLLAASTSLLLGRDESGEAKPAPSASFDAALARWREAAGRIQAFEAMFQSSNEQRREGLRAQYAAAVAAANDALIALLPSLEAVFVADPRNRPITDLVATIGTTTFDADRFDLSLRFTKLLLEHGYAKPTVYNLAGHAAYELSDLDQAEKYFRLAAKEGGLDERGGRLLDTLSEQRAELEAENSRRTAEAAADNLPRVQLETTAGEIVIELFEDDVPNTVASFLALVEDGFYDNLSFYRVVSGFGAMAGAPKDNGVGGPGYETLLELDPAKKRPHLRGTVSMIPLTRNSNGSQFFITLRPTNAERLDGKQTVFGRVIEGMDVVERLHRVDPRSPRPIFAPDRILQATVLRKRDHAYAVTSVADLAQAKQMAGAVLFGERKFVEAGDAFKQGIALLPNHHALHFNLAATYLNLRRFDEAAKELEETLRLNPKHAKAHYFLGYVQEAKGQKEKAIGHYRESLRFDPRLTQSRDALKRLLGS